MAIKKELEWNLNDVIKEGKFEQLYSEVETELQKYLEYRKELKPQISEEKFKEILKFSEKKGSNLSAQGLDRPESVAQTAPHRNQSC